MDNNYFVSRQTLLDCEKNINKMEEIIKESRTNKEIKITKNDLILLDRSKDMIKGFIERKKICKEQDIHYWVMNCISNCPESAKCHFCCISLVEYSRRERER